MAFDDVGLRVEMETPDLFEEHRPRHDLPRIAHQLFEQGEFARLQMDRLATARHVAAQHVDYEIANWYVATHAKSMLRQNLLVGRAVPGGRLTLFNRQLTLRRPATAAPIERTLTTRSEIEDVLANEFDLQIDAPDLDAVVRIIAPPEA